MQKIYCCIIKEIPKQIPNPFSLNDVIVAALVEKDGKLCEIASHWSSNEDFAKHDIGLTSDWKHEIYKQEFPEGYELEWVDNLASHPVLSKYFKIRAT